MTASNAVPADALELGSVDGIVPGPTNAGLGLSGDQAEALERMTVKSGKSKAELLRRGLQLVGEELGIEFPVRLRLL